MASANKLAFLAVVVLLLQAPWCAVAQPAVMALTSIEEGRGEPAACDGKYHSDGELFAALTTGWYVNGELCHKHINITHPDRSGRSFGSLSVVAEVVDECDTSNGCKDNMIATSKAVWAALGLDTDKGEVPVTLFLVD